MTNYPKEKGNNFELSIGPRVGIGASLASEANDLDVVKGTGLAFDAGLGVNLRFGGKDGKGRPMNGRGLIGLGVELNYALRTVGTNADKNLSLSYLDIPVLFQIYPGYQNKQLRNLYIEVGPTFSALISSSPEKITANSLIYNTGDFKGGDIKFTAGLGYRFTKGANSGFYLNFRYNVGTSNLAGNFQAKNSSAELTLGYLFKCAGGAKVSKAKQIDNSTKNINKISF